MPEDNKTRIIRRTQVVPQNYGDAPGGSDLGRTAQVGGSDKTVPVGDASGFADYSGEGTRIINPPQAAGFPEQAPSSGSSKTRLYRPGRENAPEVKNESVDPVVGWLVISKGPGMGKSFELGIGNNTVGRDKSQKVSVDFGDASISRENHFKIVYEPKKRKFYAVGGESRNLAYLNDDLFSNMVEIKNYDKISAGDTEFTFISLCGEQFSW